MKLERKSYQMTGFEEVFTGLFFSFFLWVYYYYFFGSCWCNAIPCTFFWAGKDTGEMQLDLPLSFEGRVVFLLVQGVIFFVFVPPSYTGMSKSHI